MSVRKRDARDEIDQMRETTRHERQRQRFLTAVKSLTHSDCFPSPISQLFCFDRWH